MKLATIFSVAIVLLAYKREACKTIVGRGKNEEVIEQANCGKALIDYVKMDDQEKKKLSEQDKIEKLLPWTVLVEDTKNSKVRYCVGALLQESVVATGHCRLDFQTHQNEKAHHDDHTKVFAAKDVGENGPKESAGVEVTKPVIKLKDGALSTSRTTSGRLFMLPTDTTNSPPRLPACLPNSAIQKRHCLIAGWKVEYYNDRRTFHPKAFDVKISDDAKCQEKWGPDVLLDWICVDSEELREIGVTDNDYFIFGPLVCYDSQSDRKAWTLYGLVHHIPGKGDNKPSLFTNFFKYERNHDIKKAIAELNAYAK